MPVGVGLGKVGGQVGLGKVGMGRVGSGGVGSIGQWRSETIGRPGQAINLAAPPPSRLVYFLQNLMTFFCFLPTNSE